MPEPRPISKIVITGGAGYIGNTLIQALPDEVEVVVIDNFHIDTPHKQAINAQLQKNRKVTIINANVGEVEKYQDFIHNVDVVIYMASLNSFAEANQNPSLYLQENNLNLQLFLDALKQRSRGLRKVILTSTRGVYGEGPYLCSVCQQRVFPTLADTITCPNCAGTALTSQPINETDLPNPVSYYGVTKKIQEDLLHQFCLHLQIPLDIFRIFNVFGEDQGKYYSNIGIIPRIFAQIQEKGEIYLSGGGYLSRDFIAVNDVVKILKSSMGNKNDRQMGTEVYNLGSGEWLSILDVANFFESLGHSFTRKNVGEINDVKHSVADNTKLKRVFDVSECESIRDFLVKMYTNEKVNSSN